MGFNKRFLDEKTIKSQSNINFDSFESFLTKSDMFITQDEWSSWFLKEFQKHEEGSWERRMLHLKLKEI
jgi:hypothetical protein